MSIIETGITPEVMEATEKWARETIEKVLRDMGPFARFLPDEIPAVAYRIVIAAFLRGYNAALSTAKPVSSDPEKAD